MTFAGRRWSKCSPNSLCFFASQMVDVPESADNKASEPLVIAKQNVLEANPRRGSPLYDKAGDMHYDIISAFIKSMREAQTPDAALYWLARMIDAGETLNLLLDAL